MPVIIATHAGIHLISARMAPQNAVVNPTKTYGRLSVQINDGAVDLIR
jgi:alcohol dehydrogenase YqhD (iron-dependent ADH family)